MPILILNSCTISLSKSQTDLNRLGVVLPKNPKLIFRLNFLQKLEDLKIDIGKWRTLPLAKIGRINTVKMVSLP